MDIDTLEDGWKLSHLVAQHVFGVRFNPDPFGHDEPHIQHLPLYSTRIHDAWLVVEAMIARWQQEEQESGQPTFWRFEDCSPEGWCVDVVWDHHDGEMIELHVNAPTFPLAVCRAALRYCMR